MVMIRFAGHFCFSFTYFYCESLDDQLWEEELKVLGGEDVGWE